MTRPLPVLVLIDLEPDENHHGAAKPTWTGCEQALSQANGLRQELARASGAPARLNWFLRMDPHVEATMGRADWIVACHGESLAEFERQGDTVGWHPHLLRWDGSLQQWVEDLADARWLVRCIDTGGRAFRAALGRPPVVTRVGAAYLDQTLVDAMVAVGVRLDLTLEPGIVWSKGAGRERRPPGGERACPSQMQAPYRPSPGDYLGEGGAGPLTMAPLSTARLWPGRRHQRHLTALGWPLDLDHLPVHAAMPRRTFRAVVRAWSRRRGRPEHLTVAIRSDAFCRPAIVDVMRSNLAALPRILGRPIVFCAVGETMRDFLEADG